MIPIWFKVALVAGVISFVLLTVMRTIEAYNLLYEVLCIVLLGSLFTLLGFALWQVIIA